MTSSGESSNLLLELFDSNGWDTSMIKLKFNHSKEAYNKELTNTSTIILQENNFGFESQNLNANVFGIYKITDPTIEGELILYDKTIQRSAEFFALRKFRISQNFLGNSGNPTTVSDHENQCFKAWTSEADQYITELCQIYLSVFYILHWAKDPRNSREWNGGFYNTHNSSIIDDLAKKLTYEVIRTKKPLLEYYFWLFQHSFKDEKIDTKDLIAAISLLK